MKNKKFLLSTTVLMLHLSTAALTAEEFPAGESHYRVQVPVSESTLYCTPKTGLFSSPRLNLRWNEFERYQRIKNSQVFSKHYGSIEICEKDRQSILREAKKSGGVLSRPLNLSHQPRIYLWNQNTCYDAESESASLFLGLETDFGTIGPTLNLYSTALHEPVSSSLCPVDDGGY